MLSGNSVFHVNQNEGKVYSKNDLAEYYNNLIEKITRFGLSNDSVPKDDVKKELSSVNYGFIIREDNWLTGWQPRQSSLPIFHLV